METQNDNHCSNALAEIEAGAAMLDGMLPDLVERIVEVGPLVITPSGLS